MMRRLIRYIDLLNEWCGRAVSWCTTGLVLVVCADVFFRYQMGQSSPWVMELEWHLFALIFLLGAGYTLKHDEHVRVDLFYDRFSRRDQAWINLLGGLLFLLPWAALLIYFSSQFAYSSFLIQEGSSNPGGLSRRYLIKGAIPLGFFLLFLQGLAEVLRAFLQLRKDSPKEGG